MKNTKINFLGKSIVLLFIALSFQACKNEKTTDSFSMETSQNEAVFKAYLELSDALIKSDAKLAQKTATALADAYKNEENDIVLYAVTISEIEDLEEQRTIFYQLSQRIENYVDTYIESGEVYKQYCPMAFDDKGAFWLSTSKEILNPYFGDAMLHCGTIQKTIK